MTGPNISVITVSHESLGKLPAFMEALGYDPEQGDEVIVVDSGSASPRDVADFALASRAVFLDAGSNVGYGTGSNYGATVAMNDWIAFVNPDVEVSLATLRELAVRADTNGVACIGPALKNPGTSKPRNSGQLLIRPPWRRPRSANPKESRQALAISPSISGACMVMRRSDFEAVGGFDERFFLFGEEIDLHFRLGQLGKVVACSLEHVAVTEGGGSSEGVAARWRLAERGVGHVRYVAKNFGILSGLGDYMWHVMRILFIREYRPRAESFRQLTRGAWSRLGISRPRRA